MPAQVDRRARVQPPAAAELRQLPGRRGCSSRPRSGPRSRSIPEINDYLNYVAAFAAAPGRRRSPTASAARRPEDLRSRRSGTTGSTRAGGGFGPDVDPPRLGGLRLDQPARLRDRRLRPGDPRRAGARASAASSPRSPPRPPNGGPGAGGFPDARALPDCAARAACKQAASGDFSARPHRLPAARRGRPTGGAPDRPSRSTPSAACGRASRSSPATATRSAARWWSRAATSTQGGKGPVTLDVAGPLRADHGGGRQRRRSRRRLRRRATGSTQGRATVRRQSRASRRLSALASEPVAQRGRARAGGDQRLARRGSPGAQRLAQRARAPAQPSESANSSRSAPARAAPTAASPSSIPAPVRAPAPRSSVITTPA